MIPGLLHGRLLAAGAASGVIASPAYQDVTAYGSGSVEAEATATFGIHPDGTWAGGGTGYASKSGLWFEPITAGAGNDYEVRITPTNTAGVAGVLSNDAGGWIALSQLRQLQVKVQRFDSGSTSSTYSVKVEIRPIAGAIVSTGTFTLKSTAEVVSGGGGGGGGCPAMDMWLGQGVVVSDAGIGRVIDGVAESAPEEITRLEVMASLPSLQPCYRMVTSNGAACVLSESTPFSLRDGTTRYMPEMLGQGVLRDDGVGGLVWDVVVSCYSVGEQLVARLNVGGESLLAGENPLMRIVSHNSVKV